MIVPWGRGQYIAESRTHPGEYHCAEIDDETGKVACTCLGFVRWGRCWHVTSLSRALSSRPAADCLEAPVGG